MEQNEIDELMKGVGAAKDSQAADDQLGWDDVRDEMALSARPPGPRTEISNVRFDELEKPKTEGKEQHQSRLHHGHSAATAELGRSRMLISELLQLGQGSVLELSKLAGEPMDIYVNQRLIARGEVVVVNEKFGVRLTDIVSPAERVNKLG